MKRRWSMRIGAEDAPANLTSQHKAANSADESGEEWIEGECSNKTTIDKLENASHEDITEVCIHHLELLGGGAHILIEEVAHHASQCSCRHLKKIEGKVQEHCIKLPLNHSNNYYRTHVLLRKKWKSIYFAYRVLGGVWVRTVCKYVYINIFQTS